MSPHGIAWSDNLADHAYRHGAGDATTDATRTDATSAGASPAGKQPAGPQREETSGRAPARVEPGGDQQGGSGAA